MILLYKILLEEDNIPGNNTIYEDAIQIENINTLIENEDIQIDQSFHLAKYNFELSQWEINCFLKHRKAWKLLKASSFDWAIIVEDNFNQKIDESKITSIIKQLPKEWDIFFPYNTVNSIYNKTNKKSNLLNNNIHETGIYEPYLLGYYWGSTIYFLSKEGARKILKIDKIEQRVEDELLLQSFQGEINLYAENIEWYNSNEQPQYFIKEREENIQKAIFESKAWTMDDKLLVKEILKALSFAADVLDIDLILQGGTLLGYVQMEKILPWDDDVDIGIEEKNIVRFLAFINSHTNLKYGCFIEERAGVEYYKFWLTSGTCILEHTYTFPFVDLWIHNIKGPDILFKNRMIWPNAVLRELKSVTFEGAKFKIPSNYIECLNTKYSTWKEYVRIYTYSHKTESDRFYPLRTKILVNEKGKIIYPDLKEFKIF
ncbi:MAG: LicD family protein [Ginsengibacter sp.]